ncbi:bifunctional folylpolyglutamate synthase/dihydrofolate synthase [Hydrogenimonas sp.]
MTLEEFLATKPLYYDRIDLERMPAAYDEVKGALKLGGVIHVVGTNGKGSTGRMLAVMLRALGRVGHYSSPHILRFNERIWIDGRDASDEMLEAAHRKLMGLLRSQTAEALSYFEYTTLLALVAFEGCDFVVLEAGLGGEFDATNVVPKALSLFTPIGYDHQAFLGESIEAIAATKLRSIGPKALLAPQPYPEVYAVAERIARDRGSRLYRLEAVEQGRWREAAETIALKEARPPFWAQNARVAASAFNLLTDKEPPIERLADVRLPGRFERIAPNVILDVGHNPLGARAIAQALKGERRVLVYNALADKDAEAILRTLAPVVKRLEIVPIGSERAMERSALLKAARAAGLEAGDFQGVDPDEAYLVFGSFVVVEAFLRRFKGVP